LEWLSQIAFAGAHAVGGWLGVVALTAAAVATALGLLTRFLLREWQPNAILVAVLCAFLLTAPHILTRPHILALPVMVAWIATLIRAVDTRAAPPWRALPLMMLWANLHGNFTFGLVMIAPIARDALWRAQRSDRPIVFRQWFSFALLALGAACLNPYGPEMILVTFRTVALGAALTTVAEWRSQDFTHLGAFEAIMLGAFGFALYRGVTLPWLRIVMLFGVLHLALSQVRHAEPFGNARTDIPRAPLGRTIQSDCCRRAGFADTSQNVAADSGSGNVGGNNGVGIAARYRAGRQGYPGKRNPIRPAGQGRPDPQ
jgi:hypothetical protein